MVERAKGQQRERRRRRKRKPNESDVKLAGRDHETRGTRTRRRTNGGSFSSRGSATSMQCGLCEVLASLFRRVMCIAGSRRGSGESCYQELATEVQMQQQQQSLGVQASLEPTPCSVIVAISSASPERTSSFSHRTIKEIIPEVQSRSSEVNIDPVEQNAVFIRISEDATLPVTGDTPEAPEDETDDTPPPSRRLSETDRHLLDCIDVSETRTRHTGRFLTMHKRRRKKLTTRSLNQEPGLLDDIFHGQVQCVLQRAGHWRFNAFTLETVSGGRSLPVLCVHLFKWYGLLQHFNLDVVRVWKLFALIEEGYHSTNPYHNSIHATDVTQAMHCFLQEEKIKKYLNNLEVMASLIAAVTHDLDHPGVNQPFLVATSNHLATLYENTSVLENHHWRSAIGCLLESGVYEQLPAEIRPELQRYISSLILATDITRQQEFLTRFKSYMDKNTLDMQRPEYRHFILQIALKCADISNPCRPWDISRKWSYKVCEEFFRQGDYERQLNLPVTPLCDRHTISIPKIQSGFFEFVVTPLYEEWHRFLGDGLSDTLMEHLRINQKRWQSLIVQEAAEETKTEMSDLEELQDSPSFDEEINVELPESGSCDILLSDPSTKALPSSRRSSLPVLSESQHVERRHSVPMSVAKPLTLLQPRSGRRESVPADHPKFKTPLVKLDDRGLSSLSLLSSRSSPMGSNSPSERPVSAENLLPETSIASITSSVEASRISSVLQPDSGLRPGQSRQLTRQQTFPPLQPYARIRYMSTTAEMSKYRTETLLEADSPTSSMCSSSLEKPVVTSETRRERKISTRSYTVVEPPKARRESAYADFNRLCVDSSFTSERRRHSVQCMKTDDSMATKHQRHKRPSSAQEADPTQIFYATLIGGSRIRHKSHGSDLTCSDSRPGSRSESERQWSMEESAMEEQFVDTCGPLPETSMKFKDTETRRFSAPTPENRSTESTVRRFTTIPVTTDLPVTKVFFIGSPPESPPRQKSSSGSSDSGKSLGDNGDAVASGKRDCSDVSSRHKNSKIPKLCDDLMKENVDPRTIIEETKGIFTSRRTSQGWARRRGSAPVGLMSRIDDVAPLATRVGGSTRRGSVPTDISEHRALTAGAAFRLALVSCGENLPSARRGSLPHDTTVNNVVVFADERPINNNNNNSHHSGGVGNNNVSTKLADGTIGSAMLSPRRGSVPADISELRRDFFGRNSVNGKTRNRKKTLRRRSSGGPEMFSGGQMDDNDNGSSKYGVWKRDLSKRDAIPEPSVKRRGSLPVEMVSISHSGRYNYR